MVEGILEGVFKAGLFWLCIIVVGIIVSISTKKAYVKISILLISFLSLPLYVVFELSGIPQYFNKLGFDREKSAFEAFCSGRKHQIYSKAEVLTNPILGIEITNIDDPIALHADYFVDRLQLKKNSDKLSQLCTKTNLRFIEGSEPNGEKYKVGLCDSSKLRIEDWSAPYMIRFGPRYDVTRNPQSSYRPFSKTQMQMIERSTGKVLAEDTLFNYTFASRDGKCPYEQDQLFMMILDIFQVKNSPSFNSSAEIH